MSVILSCPDSGAHPTDSVPFAVDVQIDGQHLLTIGFGPIAPARSAWLPDEQFLVLDVDEALGRSGVVA